MIELILIILLVISAYIIYNLYRKNVILERINELNSEWIDTTHDLIRLTHKKLKSVDSANLFEKDDDVGFVFSNILEIIKSCEEKINNYGIQIQSIKGVEVKKEATTKEGAEGIE
jgi:hypothetical protein